MKTIKATELTPHQRIEILEDVLQKLESCDTDGGLCCKIEDSALELLRVWDKAKNIIPLLTIENARKVTEVNESSDEWGYWGYWWKYLDNYDFENRIKFVNWMIEQEKLTNNINNKNKKHENKKQK